ncbi:TPA: uracil-DNA glycosylase, partial [Candidatus Galligastranaerophilus intestinigallinarum]|nr:uracil-DNA glycosylase [Candidatus Galligastranaerophilus intestinigallinarum]
MEEELEKLKQKCLKCTKCSLSKTRTNVVFSDGIPNNKLVLVGEAPGFYEDKT